MRPRCNILFIMADQFRRDALRHQGGHGRTDALDALAADGVSFTRATTTSPECIPARFALATGLYPHQTGVWQNAPPVVLSPTAWTWTSALLAAGYRTSLFGKTHFHDTAQASGDLRDGLSLMRGYGLLDVDEISGPRGNTWIASNMTEGWQRCDLLDAYRRDFEERFAGKPWVARPSPLGLENYYDTYVGRRALDYLASYNRPEPWFCWMSFAGPHEPWDAPAPYDKLHMPADMPPPIPRPAVADPTHGLLGELFRASDQGGAPSPQEIMELRANYAGNVSLIDDQIGALCDLLKSRSLYDQTLIVFTSDHGEMNGDHGLLYKGNFLASSVDIPLVVRPPGGQIEGRPVADNLVELIDVGATILDYAGVEQPAEVNGQSLRPLLDGRRERHRAFAVAEFREHTMVATRCWKAEFDPLGQAALLVDRRSDPLEQHNLAGDHRYDSVADRLSGLLRDFRAATRESRTITL